MKTIGGFFFTRNAVKFDYNLRETVQCLLDCCDQVSVCYVEGESDDGTWAILDEFVRNNEKLKVVKVGNDVWEREKGKEKLAYFQNIAAAQLTTDYQFLLQADEILHEDCYPVLRQAIQTAQEGYLVTRVNLWGSPYKQLNVAQNRLPCSNQVIRLTKTGYKTVDDGESISAQAVDWFLKSIRIYHLGFVRDRKIHPLKIHEMQVNVFGMGEHDSKLDRPDGTMEFDPTKWFNPEYDLKDIDEPLPKIIQEWARLRE